MSILEWQGNKNYIDETETISDCLAVTVHHTFFCELSFGMIVPVNSAVVIIELEVINFTENFMTPSLVFFSVSKYLSESLSQFPKFLKTLLSGYCSNKILSK